MALRVGLSHHSGKCNTSDPEGPYKGPRGRCYTTRGKKSWGGLGPGFASILVKLLQSPMLAVRLVTGPRDGRTYPGARSGALQETLASMFSASDVR